MFLCNSCTVTWRIVTYSIKYLLGRNVVCKGLIIRWATFTTLLVATLV
jgi:hypothetical protein